jgi:hypothetical protein
MVGAWHSSNTLLLGAWCFYVTSALGALLFCAWHSWHSIFFHLVNFAFLELGFCLEKQVAS